MYQYTYPIVTTNLFLLTNISGQKVQMKKITLIIGLALLITNVFGQETITEYGLKAGLNYSKYTPNLKIGGVEILDFNGRFGFYAGGYIRFGFSDILKLQPELLFALQGSNTSSEIELRPSVNEAPVVGKFKTSITESTISIPVMLQLYPSEKFYFELGPQIGYIIARKEKVTNDPFVEFGSPFGVSENCSSCDKFDFGGALGLGYIVSERININVRYFAGLIERNNTIKSSVLNVGLGYKL